MELESPRRWSPTGTYTLLGIMLGVYILQQLSLEIDTLVRYRGAWFDAASWTFVIRTDWFWRPWTLVTSTLAHDFFRPMHLLFNGLFLFFFGPTVERIIGTKRFFVLFFAAGAVSGVTQVELASLSGPERGALGASGALMALFGILMIIVPKQTILVWGVLPVPMWLAGIGYAAIDVLGAFDRASGIGNFAHLSGMAIGLGYAMKLRRDWRQRGLHTFRDDGAGKDHDQLLGKARGP